MNLPKQFEESLARLGCVRRGERILAAVSGGLDSMVMLELFTALRKKRKWEIFVGHVNHSLRGRESDGDEAFVRKRAELLGLRCLSVRIDVRAEAKHAGKSIEEAARDLRYRALERMRLECGARWIATAHHADDNAETILAHLIRGAGAGGLRGIHPRRGCIIRPLLFAERQALLRFANTRKISWREDSTNREITYRRNFIRRRLLPAIRELNPGIAGTLTRTSAIFRSLDLFIGARVEKLGRKLVRVDGPKLHLAIPGLNRYFDFEKYALIQRAIGDFYECQPTFEEVDAVIQLANAPIGKFLKFRKNGRIFRDREVITFVGGEPGVQAGTKIRPGEKAIAGEWTLAIERVSPPKRVKKAGRLTEYLDAAKAGEEFLLRKWRSGDRFVPLGAPGRKKVSDFLVDRKVGRVEKENLLVLEGAGGIVWVCGMRIDERVKIDGGTRSALKLTLKKKK